MINLECLEIFSSFKDDQLTIPKKGQCNIHIDNTNEICYINLIFTMDKEFFDQNFEHQLKKHKVFSNIITV